VVDGFSGIGDAWLLGCVTRTVTSTWRVTSCVTVFVRVWQAASTSIADKATIANFLTSMCLILITSILFTCYFIYSRRNPTVDFPEITAWCILAKSTYGCRLDYFSKRT
jgi:hypothetical protein